MKNENMMFMKFFLMSWFSFFGAHVYSSDQNDLDSEGLLKTNRFFLTSKTGRVDFEIHVPKEKKEFALRVRKILANEGMELIDYLGYLPTETVHLSVDTSFETANGAATVFPTNMIYLYDFPPLAEGQLSYSKDWLKILVIHELMHVLHMDQTTDFLGAMRSVFGSNMKWGGIVPRWFAEGMAVWAETHFSDEGRLSSPSFHHEFSKLLVRPRYCDNIDCLDNPGKFPFGGHGYWAGAFFMDWLEKQKSGSIRCLIEQNSGSLPFFLNNAFETCMGAPAALMFSAFRNKKIQSLSSAPDLGSKVDYHGENFLNLHLGRALSKDYLAFGLVKGDITKLVVENLESGIQKEFSINYYIQNMEFDKTGKSLILPLYFYRGRGTARYLGRINIETMKFEVLGSTRSQYFFQSKSGQIFSLEYKKLRWGVYSYAATDYSNLDLDDKKLHKQFPAMFDISRPFVVNVDGVDYLRFLTHIPESSEFSVSQTRLDSADYSSTTLYQSPKSFDLVGDCNGKTIIRNPLESGVISIENDANSVKLTQYSGKATDRLIRANFFENKGIIYFDGLPFQGQKVKFGCEKLFSEEIAVKQVTAPLKNHDMSPILSANKKAYGNEYKYGVYPHPRLYLPHYWFPSFLIANKGGYVGAQTSVSDPNQNLTFNLKGKYFYDLEKLGLDVDGVLRLGETYFQGLYEKAYDAYRTNSYLEQDSHGARVFSDFHIGHVTLTPGAYYQRSWISDFLSRRRLKTYGLYNVFSYYARNEGMFLNDITFVKRIFKQESKVENTAYEYWGGQGKLSIDFNLSARFELDLLGSYGRLGKASLDNGVIMGGGYQGTHQFLPLLHGDLYGNSIWTGRAQGKFLLSKNHSGPDFFPYFLKRLYLFAGAEMASANRVYIDSKWHGNRTLTGIHGGLRSTYTVAYRIPIAIELAYAKVINNSTTQPVSFLFMFKGGF
ncbi:MAG: hypothetical protein HOE90_07600 [Bacteriovoracaceae bacterium]|jgi:hypothetical protein|nr:hypothetical protein [Bacteriovoracaceae bacterium]